MLLFDLFWSCGLVGSQQGLIASMMIEMTWKVWWPFGDFSGIFRDLAEDVSGSTSGAPGELIWGSRGAQLRSNRSSFSK